MQKIHVLCGATASGKSARASALAKRSNGVIINADSQQLYKEFRILTARPAIEDEACVPHKLYGILSAEETGSAAIWLRHAQMEIDWALSNGQTPIITGGTGLYMRVLMQGMAEIPDILPEIRAQSKADLEHMGAPAFHARLGRVDAASAALIRVSDRQRLIRAYAVWLGTGKPLSQWKAKTNNILYDKSLFNVIHVELPREELYARINARVIAMIKEGAVEEVREFIRVKRPEQESPACKIIGVREITDYLHGMGTLEETTARIQQATRNYAKRQLTWFRHQL